MSATVHRIGRRRRHDAGAALREWLERPLRREWLAHALRAHVAVRHRQTERPRFTGRRREPPRPWHLEWRDGRDDGAPAAFETHDAALVHAAAVLAWRPDDLEARFGPHYALALEYVSAPDNPNDWAGGPDPIQEVYLVDVEVPERGALRGRLVEAASGRFVETVPLDDDTRLGLAVAEMLADGAEPGEVLVRDLHYDPVSDTLSFDAREALAARFVAQGQDVVELEAERLAGLEYEPGDVADAVEGTVRAGALLARMQSRLPGAAACPLMRARLFVEAVALVRLVRSLAEVETPPERPIPVPPAPPGGESGVRGAGGPGREGVPPDRSASIRPFPRR